MALPICVIDAETDPFAYESVPQPFVWGIYDGEDFEYFEEPNCTEKLVKFLSDKKIIVYAHNGGKFDFFYLLPYLNRDSILVINGRISKAMIGDCELRDSFNILPIALAKYKKDVVDYKIFVKGEREKDHNRIKILDYLESDCVYTHELVMGFIDKFGRKLTLAGAATSELKRTVQEKYGRKFENMSPEMDAIFRPYYYGGRCEAIRGGVIDGPLKVYDINSAYPYAMSFSHPDPTRIRFTVSDTLPDTGCYFAMITATSRGALPFRSKDGLSFPRDNIERDYNATGWEIIAGLDTGTLDIKCVNKVYVPDYVMYFSNFTNT